MKRIISLLICLCLLCACAVAEEGAFAMLEKLYTAGKNTVYSPVSLNAALGMAAEGAAGATRDEILAVIGSAVSPEIKSANALFVSPEIELYDAYKMTIDKHYAAEYFAIDAQVVEKANRWISKKTDGMIENFMQAPPDATGLILLNAVAMEKDWAKPFEEDATYEEEFYALNEIVPVQMMHQTSFFNYAEKDGAQIICLPYADSNLEMWIAMPQAGEMEALLAKIREEGMNYLTGEAESAEVFLCLPKLDVTNENNLVAPLKELGVQTAFSDFADFSGICSEPMFISGVTQRARMKMDEKSTSAAAVTMVVLERMAIGPDMPQPVTMDVNRPYFFAVVDEDTGAVCFCGVIENPLA